MNDDKWRISGQDAGQSNNYMQSTTQEEWSKSYQQNALRPAELFTRSLATMAPMQLSPMPFITAITSSAGNYASGSGGSGTTNNRAIVQPLPSYPTLTSTLPTSTSSPFAASTAASASASVSTLQYTHSSDKIEHAMNTVGRYTDVATTTSTLFPGITPLPTFSGSTQNTLEGMTSRATTMPTPFVYSEERTLEHPVEYEEEQGGEEPTKNITVTLRPPMTTRRPTTRPTGPMTTIRPTGPMTTGPTTRPTMTQPTSTTRPTGPMTTGPTMTPVRPTGTTTRPTMTTIRPTGTTMTPVRPT